MANRAATGLLVLSSQQMPQELPPSLAFWRGLARDFFHAVCQLGEAGFDRWAVGCASPDRAIRANRRRRPAHARPRVSQCELLRSLWGEFAERVAAEAAKLPEGPAAFLRSLNPLWHLLGRVTFHLAENKRDPERPFAFLATYTHRLSGQARLAHLPLAEALKTYAGAKELAKLESLLEPVRRAAERSGFARELLDKKPSSRRRHGRSTRRIDFLKRRR